MQDAFICHPNLQSGIILYCAKASTRFSSDVDHKCPCGFLHQELCHQPLHLQLSAHLVGTSVVFLYFTQNSRQGLMPVSLHCNRYYVAAISMATNTCFVVGVFEVILFSKSCKEYCIEYSGYIGWCLAANSDNHCDELKALLHLLCVQNQPGSNWCILCVCMCNS